MSRLEAEFRRPRREDALALASTLRSADRAELAALGLDPAAALVESLARSSSAAAVWDLQGLVALLGVAPIGGSLLAPVGAPWMMGTDRITAHRRTLARVGPAYTRTMLAEYPRLVNMVHAKNTLHVAWLKRLGFRFQPHPVAAPASGEPFLVFEMNRHV